MGRIATESGRHWDGHYVASVAGEHRIRDWLEHEYIRKNYINPQVSGDPVCNWLSFIAEFVLRPARPRRVLDIGCGKGPVTLTLASATIGETVIGVDTSASAIEIATASARVLGLEDKAQFICGSANDLEYPSGSLDAVIINMALHHILDLEGIIASIREWLAPGCPLILFEYIGPNRFQWTRAALDAGNRALQSLPPELRVHGETGKVIETIYSPSYKAMLVGDASEAIRSAEIVDITNCFFTIDTRRDFGGTILHPLLADIVHNFRLAENPSHAGILDRLFDLERRLIEDGTLSSNFSLMIYR